MVFISLGFACRVRESIDRFDGFRVETNFFDWLLTNFETVLFIIQNIDHPEKFLTKDKFIKNEPSSNNLTHYTLNHTQLYFSSLHDVPSDKPYDENCNLFIEKYKRRLKRLKDIILKPKETIHFIHMIPFPNMIPTIENVYYFIIAIQNINKDCSFYLHLFIPPELHQYKTKIDSLCICANIKAHYLTSVDPSQPKNEQRLDLNWKEKYQLIKRFCN